MEGIGCAPRCFQFTLIGFNLLFWLSGVALLAIGIWIRVDDSYERYVDVLDEIDDSEFIHIAAYILIGAGALVFLVGFMGCCGAWKLNKCMLGIYAILLLLVLCIELSAAVYAVVKKKDILSSVREEWSDVIKEKYQYTTGDEKPTGFTRAMDLLQIQFECCGVRTNKQAEAYKDSTWAQASGERVPLSCCAMIDRPDTVEEVNEFLNLPRDEQTAAFVGGGVQCMADGQTNINKEGCLNSLENFVEDKAAVLIGVGVGIACIEVFGIVFAICLCRKASRRKEELSNDVQMKQTSADTQYKD